MGSQKLLSHGLCFECCFISFSEKNPLCIIGMEFCKRNSCVVIISHKTLVDLAVGILCTSTIETTVSTNKSRLLGKTFQTSSKMIIQPLKLLLKILYFLCDSNRQMKTNTEFY